MRRPPSTVATRRGTPLASASASGVVGGRGAVSEGAEEGAERLAVRLREADQARQRAEPRLAAAEDDIERGVRLGCA